MLGIVKWGIGQLGKLWTGDAPKQDTVVDARMERSVWAGN